MFMEKLTKLADEHPALIKKKKKYCKAQQSPMVK